MPPKSRRTCSLKKHPISVVFIFVRLNFNQKRRQLINGNMKITSWGVAAIDLLGFDEDSELEQPLDTTAKKKK